MIAIDSREAFQHKEFISLIRGMGVMCDKMPLSFADFAFEGKGPDGNIGIGIERKTLHDMLSCVDDSRYSAHQRVGMAEAYSKSFLIIEGIWKPHDGDGTLMEGFNNGTSWGPCRYRSQRVLYSKLYRYLISISLSGVNITYSRNLRETAINVCEIYWYFQKRWEDHTSMLQTQMLNIPSLTGAPSLIREWAARLPGVGVKLSMEAERKFKLPITLATADEIAWMQLPGVGAVTARNIVREIWTGKKP